jgi:para-aminobenzoate synthetase/4-amino-4-deoxychorismate lyase
MKLQKLTSEPGTVFLSEGFSGTPLFFSAPIQIIEARKAEEITVALEQIRAFNVSGYYCVGFISYEAGAAIMGVEFDESDFPFLWFGVYDKPSTLEIAKPDLNVPAGLVLYSKLNFDSYSSGFKKIKKEIKAGNTYQINYTFRSYFESEISPSLLFSYLYHNHPVPYGAFISTDRYQIASLSPELFVRRQGDKLTTRPMKGTASRSADCDLDQKRKRDLRNSEKERAENLMIVDLMRNDLGKLARPGTVKVPRLFEIEQYKTVHQMVSTVEARIDSCSPAEIIQALFPSGSITGAPKKSSMEIISRVENTPRKIYTGSIGLFPPTGNFCLNIAIRTALFDNQKETGELGIGGGIVSDGQPENEWREAWLKSEFINSFDSDFSVIETMRYCPRKGIELLPLHLKRLTCSARHFNIPLNIVEVRKKIAEKLEHRKQAAALRLLLTREGEVSLEVKNIPPTPEVVKLKLALRSFNPVQKAKLKHKTTDRSFYNKYRKKATENGCFEYAFYDRNGYISEGTISNVYIKKKNRLLTPPLEEGVLPGVMREHLLKTGQAREEKIYREELKSAEEVYLSNALRGLIKVDTVIP